MTPRVIPIGSAEPHPRPAAPGRQSGSPGARLAEDAPGDLPVAKGPERATFPFGPNIRAFLKQFMPIAEYGARCVADSDKLAERAREMARS